VKCTPAERLFAAIRDHGGSTGLTGNELCRRSQWLDLWSRRQLLRSLVADGLVTVRTIAGRSKPTTVYVATSSQSAGCAPNGISQSHWDSSLAGLAIESDDSRLFPAL
jgi:hypothetical protein